MKFDKKRLYPIFLILLMYTVYVYRDNQQKKLQVIIGETMGTTYTVKYLGKENYKHHIDSLLIAVNRSMSTYIPDSEISRFNTVGNLTYESPYFYPVIAKAKEIYENTSGAFDPTVMPLVNAWGFGFKNKEKMDSLKVDSLLQFVGFSNITFDEQKVTAKKEGIMLDFSAIAKGYGVDVIGQFLRSNNILHFMVEIGGEVLCSGKNKEEEWWKIGIDNPEGGENLSKIVSLQNEALATSGNYRNFYIDEQGAKRAHTLNPTTGFPAENTLLSASVKAKDCMTADGYATALMVLGADESKKLAQNTPEIAVFLIYSDSSEVVSWQSERF
jgi:FAD:protein FMN transferase